MDYEEKKEYALNFVLTGLSLEESLLYSGMNEEEIEKAMNDSYLNEQIKIILYKEHIRLRSLLKNTIERNAKQKNDWKGVIALLEIMFPDKYNHKTPSSKPSLEIDEDDAQL